MLMFAYGANTHIDSMSRRCPTALDLGPATLPNYQYRFARHADVVPGVGRVSGVLWDITQDDLYSLDRFEGYPNYYERKTVLVEHRGALKEALVYYMTPGHVGALPGQGYLDMILEGFQEHNVDTKQVFDALNCLEQQNV
jgi:gamma-glutamylcyclotransferase (GGCT)/AIG2-like uncharacterized protein YtfP